LTFKVNEIKGWAEKHGVTVKRQDGGYVWFAEGEEPSDPESMDDVVRSIFNKITQDRFVEYQKDYESSRVDKPPSW
jgi:hypothetical protein